MGHRVVSFGSEREIEAFVTTTAIRTQNNERHNLNSLLVITQIHAQVFFHR